MVGKGVILSYPVRGEWRYGKLIFAVGVYERQLTTLTPELERDALQYMREAFGEAFHSKQTTQMRIVPVNKTIAVERSVTTYDNIRAYVEESAGPFARMNCICRHGKELLGEKCLHTELRENCLTFGRAARWAADACGARMITREEMLALLDEADKEGLVLQPENTKKPLFVCCCCGCCCGVLTMAKQFAHPADYFSSSFQVAANADACESCGTCELRCQMDAINTRSGTAEVDLARCIGCALCVSTCQSGALRLERKDTQKLPPDDTQALYLKILQERYGPWGMAKLGVRKLLGMKI
jgi:Na+-translocating ferredoxin:NAD+ oxidoreductase subunit B